MSSMVIFNRHGVIAEWHKQAPYTVRGPGLPVIKYTTRSEALDAATKLSYDNMTVPTVYDAIALARAFGTEMQEALTRHEFNDMLDRNKSNHTEDHECASHDFVDANMLMLEAFKKTFGREPAILHLNDAHAAIDTQLWNDAWAIAKAAEFFA